MKGQTSEAQYFQFLGKRFTNGHEIAYGLAELGQWPLRLIQKSSIIHPEQCCSLCCAGKRFENVRYRPKLLRLSSKSGLSRVNSCVDGVGGRPTTSTTDSQSATGTSSAHPNTSSTADSIATVSSATAEACADSASDTPHAAGFALSLPYDLLSENRRNDKSVVDHVVLHSLHHFLSHCASPNCIPY